MHTAAEKGHAEAVSLLLSSKADVEAHLSLNVDPRTPLHLAAEYAHEPCVSLLLSKGADPLAALPTGFLSQFKNYKSLSLQIRRASCHAAALASHFRDEGWMETVAVLDKAVAKRKAKCLDEPTADADDDAAAEGRAGKKKTLSTRTAA